MSLKHLTFPLLIDGGLSNVLEANGCDLNHKLWSAKLLDENPESIIQAHYEYLEAGAGCLTTSSYQASVPGFMDLGHDRATAELLILKSIELAELAIARAEAAGIITAKPLIAASIGPYGAYLANGSEYRGDYGVSDDVLITFHRERIQLLEGSNADFFACETIPSLQEANALAGVLHEATKPAWVSFSCKDEQHLNDGTNMETVATLFAHHPNVFAIGVNCTAPKYISGLINAMKAKAGTKQIVVYPNSGEAYNAERKTWLGISDPELFVAMAKEWTMLGATIVGGCCRIGPQHIRSMKDLLFSD